jgi:hypothetical protein
VAVTTKGGVTFLSLKGEETEWHVGYVEDIPF